MIYKGINQLTQWDCTATDQGISNCNLHMLRKLNWWLIHTRRRVMSTCQYWSSMCFSTHTL